MSSATVRVPASTSNLGSGFDTLGLAVNLYNKITLSRANSKTKSSELPPMVTEAAKLFFKRTGISPFRFDIQITGNIPVARGIGASGALRAAIVAGLNELTRARLS